MNPSQIFLQSCANEKYALRENIGEQNKYSQMIYFSGQLVMDEDGLVSH